MASQKAALILGGTGALGKSMVNTFKSNGWKAISMAPDANTEASANVLIDTHAHLKDQVGDLLQQTTQQSSSYNAIICVAGGFDVGSVKDHDIIEKYERLDKMNFQTALLAGHLASHTLTESGFLMFTGAAAVFSGPVNYAYAYAMTKSATHALALNMAERDCIPLSASVVTILPQIIDTPANREAMPDADFDTWAPTDKIAQLVRGWADGDNRPLNGSFAQLDYTNGAVVPKFL